MNYLRDFMETNRIKVYEKFLINGEPSKFSFSETGHLFMDGADGHPRPADYMLPELFAGKKYVISLREPSEALKSVVKALGLEFYSPFYILRPDGEWVKTWYMFTAHGLVDNEMVTDEYALSGLLTGRYKIEGKEE